MYSTHQQMWATFLRFSTSGAISSSCIWPGGGHASIQRSCQIVRRFYQPSPWAVSSLQIPLSFIFGMSICSSPPDPSPFLWRVVFSLGASFIRGAPSEQTLPHITKQLVCPDGQQLRENWCFMRCFHASRYVS